MIVTKPDMTKVWANGASPGNVLDPEEAIPDKIDLGWIKEEIFYQHENYLKKWFSQGLAYINQQGIGVWDSSTEYPLNGLTKAVNGVVYQAIVTNTNSNPVSDEAKWHVFGEAANVTQLRLIEPISNGVKITLVGHTLTGIGGGEFYYDSSDTTTIDDNGSVYVTAGGRRVKRLDFKDATPDIFGALANGSDDAVALNSFFSVVKTSVINDKNYSFGSRINVSVGDGENFKTEGTAKLTRLASYEASENAIVITGTATSDISVHGLEFVDDSNQLTEEMLKINVANIGTFYRVKTDGINVGVILVNVKEPQVLSCDIRNGSGLAIKASGNGNIKVGNCRIDSMHTGVKASVTGTPGNVVSAVEVSACHISNTGDGAIFVRGFAGNTIKNIIVGSNILENIGKSPIKVSVPAGNDGALLENINIHNNVINGYAQSVNSAAIAVFRDGGDSTTRIVSVSILGNVIDGRAVDETASAASGDAYGIRISYAEIVDCQNTIQHTPAEGIWVDHCKGGSFRDTINKACQNAAGGGDAGATFSANNPDIITDYNGLSINLNVTETGNGKSGLLLTQTQDCTVKGLYSRNGNYGIEESSSGTSERKAGNNVIVGAMMKGNTTAPILYLANGQSGMTETGCYDDDGARNQGNTARRNALGFTLSKSSKGYVFSNDETGQIERHAGSNVWTDAMGDPA